MAQPAQQLPPSGCLQAVHCSIIGNKLYCMPTSLPSWEPTRSFLLSILRKVKVSDSEFYWVQASQPGMPNSTRPNVPILSSAIGPTSGNVPIPSAHLTDAVLQGRHIAIGCTAKEWTGRARKVFYRAGNTGSCYIDELQDVLKAPKFAAALVAKNRSDLFDLKLYPSDLDSISRDALAHATTLGLLTSVILPGERATEQRFGLEIDGPQEPVGFADLMAAGVVMLKQQTEYIEWYTPLLQPQRHFLEFQLDSGGLEQVGKALDTR